MADRITPTDGGSGEGEHERSWFIRGKLAAPVHQVRLVSREHLLTRLDRLLHKRLGRPCSCINTNTHFGGRSAQFNIDAGGVWRATPRI